MNSYLTLQGARILAALSLMMSVSLAAAPAAKEAPVFSLQRRDGSGEVRLSDFTGKIVVLDFFAYWCIPCAKASSEIESRIREHYRTAKGNPLGISVEVLAVNVEAEQRARTEAFIKKHRLGQVVDDVNGAILAAYGGASLPHVVIIDGSGGTPEKPEFRIVYQRGGFEGADKLRAIIDRLGPARPRAWVEPKGDAWELVLARADGSQWIVRGPLLASLELPMMTTEATTAGEPEEPATPEELPATHGPLDQRASLGFEGLFASDIQLSQSSAGYRAARSPWEGTFSAGVSLIGLDYRPVEFDFLGESVRVNETRGFVRGGGRWRLGERFTVVGGGGLYDGYTDYRSAWLAEYYRQQFSGLPGYTGPSPAGYNAAVGLRWEYLPATGFAQLDYSYLRDEIAPGYEIDFDGLRRGRSYLYTSLFKLSFENLVGRRLRLLHEFRRVDTSDRELRLGYQGSANVALGERWTVRMQGGVATEDPQFDAWYVGGTLEYEVSPRWLVSLNGRYYEDTGEIENSNFSNAAPALQAWQVGMGVRYVGDGFAAKLSAAPYATRYAPIGIGTAFFGNLYANRDWGLVEAALEITF